jgi:hypothetical protein
MNSPARGETTCIIPTYEASYMIVDTLFLAQRCFHVRHDVRLQELKRHERHEDVGLPGDWSSGLP